MELDNIFINSPEKYSYSKLRKSDVHELMLIISSDKTKKIFSQKYLYSKIEFLLCLSSYIDKKINSNYSLYRSKNGRILIDEISNVVSSKVFEKDKCTLFKLYKKLCIKYKIRAKEDKIFKFLLAEKLIKNLYLSEIEAIEISKIIKSSASAKKLHKFKKKIYSYAEIYSVKKYNPNATKILSKQEIDFKSVANKLFSELYETKLVQSVIVSYLTKIFHDNL